MRVLVCFGLLVIGCGPGDTSGADLSSNVPPDLSMTLVDLAAADLSLTGSDGPATGMGSFAQLSADWAAAVCANLMACGRLVAADLASCLEEQALAPPAWDADGELAAGHVSLDETACLAALRTARCDGEEAGKSAAACAGLWVPHVDAGGACVDDRECVSGFCATHPDGGSVTVGCRGVCAGFGATGVPCDSDAQCDPTAFCDLGTSKCVPRPKANTACATNTPCAPGLYCAGALTDPNGTGNCTAPTTPGALGAACDPGESMTTSTPTCTTGLFCQVTVDAGGNPNGGKCAAHIATDGACDPSSVLIASADNPCVDGDSCFAIGVASAACHALSGSGEPCSVESDCRSPFHCDPLVSRCVPKLATGAACDPTAQICLAGSAAGLPTCVTDVDPDAGGATLCEAPLGWGAACAPGEDARCTTGACVSGHCGVVCN
jgi:hypothetical protein